jgi:TonB family protein
MLRGCTALVVVAACGGSSAPPPKKPDPQPLQRTRIPIEEPDEDEGPQDGVQIQSTKGHMEMATIEAGIEPHKQTLSDCYMTKVGKRKWLGGRVALHWDINKAGEITAVKLAESDLGNYAIEKCLLEAARAATFGKPVGGDADFSIPLDFSAKGRLLSWDEDQALRAVGGQLASLDECAHPDTAGQKKGGKRKPSTKRATLPDDVVVTMYVGPGGKAQSVGFSSGKSEIDPAWAECAERLALGWRLTDPKGVIAKLAIRYRAN